MIEGLSHMTFIVKNLEKTKHMLEYLFSAEEVYSSDGKNFSVSNEKFFIRPLFKLFLYPLIGKSYSVISAQLVLNL